MPTSKLQSGDINSGAPRQALSILPRHFAFVDRSRQCQFALIPHPTSYSSKMGYEIQIVVAYTLVSLLVGLAWVAGYLDKYQSKAQEVLLDKMGENKVSHGLKSKN